MERASQGDRLLSSGEEAGSAPEDRKFRPDVEGLRAVAIVLVVLIHVGIPEAQGGFVGVDVFFVISGFVITGLLLRERQSSERINFLTFYARRARRILPAALLVIIVSLIATAVLLGGRDTIATASDSRWTIVFLGNIHFASVDPNILFGRPSPLGQFWSLAVEEQFYLLYPALFVALIALGGIWSRRTKLAVGLAAVAVCSFAYSVASTRLGELGAYDSTFARAWELAVGALVALGANHVKRLPSVVATALTWLGVGMILCAAVTFSARTVYPGYAAAVPVLGAALVIAAGTAVPRFGAEYVLRLRPFQWLGRLSYSWYLWHFPILFIAAERAHSTVSGLSPAYRLGLTLLGLGLAAASYYLVENPVRHSKRLAGDPRATVVGATLLMASCFAFTYAF